MSASIKSRTSAQCRSYHQKMLIKFGDIDSIIKYNQELAYESFKKKFVPKLLNNDENLIQTEKLQTMISFASAPDLVDKPKDFLANNEKFDVIEEEIDCLNKYVEKGPISFFDFSFE